MNAAVGFCRAWACSAGTPHLLRKSTHADQHFDFGLLTCKAGCRAPANRICPEGEPGQIS